MTQKRKKRASIKRSRESEFNELFLQGLKTAIALANRGIALAEEQAKKRRLFKTYPYLDQAFSNVKNVIGFFQSSFNVKKPGKGKSHERTKRKKGHKKISKPQTVRHAR